MPRKYNKWTIGEMKTLYDYYGRFPTHVIQKNNLPERTTDEIHRKVNQLKTTGKWNELALKFDRHGGVKMIEKMPVKHIENKEEKKETEKFKAHKNWKESEDEIVSQQLMEFTGPFKKLIESIHDLLPHRSKTAIQNHLNKKFNVVSRTPIYGKFTWEKYMKQRENWHMNPAEYLKKLESQELGCAGETEAASQAVEAGGREPGSRQHNGKPEAEKTGGPRFHRPARQDGLERLNIGFVCTGPVDEIMALGNDVEAIAEQYNAKLVYVHKSRNKLWIMEPKFDNDE